MEWVGVDILNSVTYFNRTPALEWYVVWCGFKNRYQKGMCLIEFELCI